MPSAMASKQKYQKLLRSKALISGATKPMLMLCRRIGRGPSVRTVETVTCLAHTSRPLLLLDHGHKR